jgi:hypothetical protein
MTMKTRDNLMLDWITHVRAGANDLLYKRLTAGVSSLSYFLSEREKALAEGRDGLSDKLEHIKEAYRKYSDQSEKAHREFMEHVRSFSKEKEDAGSEADVTADRALQTDSKPGASRHHAKHS